MKTLFVQIKTVPIKTIPTGKGRVCWALLAVLIAPTAFADKKDDLYKKAVSLGSAGQLEDAARTFCEVAKQDSTYKDATQMCSLMTQEAERERKKNDERFDDGVRAFQDGHYDDAERKFKNVRSGSHLEEARQYLASKIPAARAEQTGSETENAKFDQGLQAYQRNDFPAARTLLSQVTGKKSQEAQTYLTRIKNFERAIAAGDDASNQKDFRKAIDA